MLKKTNCKQFSSILQKYEVKEDYSFHPIKNNFLVLFIFVFFSYT